MCIALHGAYIAVKTACRIVHMVLYKLSALEWFIIIILATANIRVVHTILNTSVNIRIVHTIPGTTVNIKVVHISTGNALKRTILYLRLHIPKSKFIGQDRIRFGSPFFASGRLIFLKN